MRAHLLLTLTLFSLFTSLHAQEPKKQNLTMKEMLKLSTEGK